MESAVEPQKTANAVIVVVVIVVVFLVLMAVKSSSHSTSTARGGAQSLRTRCTDDAPWLRMGFRVVSGARRKHKTASGARLVDVVHHGLLVPRRQCHAALSDVSHELALPVRCAHAQASLGSHETLSVVDITICSATP